MEYPIYTYGGGEQLVAVFNAIGMIFESDSKYLTPVGTMSMSLGGVYIAIKAIFKGDFGLFGRSWLIPSLVAFMLLFAPKATVWIKDDVANTAGVKVDNIPFGIAFFTSLGTTTTHELSKLMEQTMLPASSNGATQTGTLYGAKAVAKLRDVQIQDPIFLMTTKEYMRQCYMKPYIIGNFGGLKSEAQKEEDILGWLEKHPVKCFGIKPINKDGTVGEFQTCTAAGTLIKQAIEEHSKDPNLLSKFAAVVGLSTSKQGEMTKLIKAMTTNTLSYLDQSQQDIHEWMKQSMVLNANREAYDDWRQKVGHPRVFPELVKMQATRGMFQQSLGSIVGGEMAESKIPAAVQPVMLSLVVMAFVIILPFALLPGGWSYIVTGIKLMIWVSSWPLFYTIIHAIVMMQIKDAAGGWGESGLSVIGQGGFTELILMKYAAAQDMITAVPILSFAIVFGSPYAFSSIAGAIAGTSASASIGANMADGNISMAQRSYNTLNRDQENHAPSLTMGGGIIDDGEMRVQSDARGNMVLTEHTDNMANSYKRNENLANSVSANFSNATSNILTSTDRESSLMSVTDSENLDVARNVARGTTHSEGLNETYAASLKKVISHSDSLAKDQGTGQNKTVGTNSHVDVKTPGAFGAITGLTAGTGTNASSSNHLKDDVSIQERAEAQMALDQIRTAARTGGLTSTHSDDIRLNKSFASNLSKLDQVGHEKAKAIQDADTYSKQLAYIKTNSGTIDRNANDEVMREVMNRHPELQSKEQAARWMKSHRSEADEIARPIINDPNPFRGDLNGFSYENSANKIAKLDHDTQNLKKDGIATQDSLYDAYSKNQQKVRSNARVKDDTGEEKPLIVDVNNTIQDSKNMYNNDVDTVLKKGFTEEEGGMVQKVNQGQTDYNKAKADYEVKKAEMSESTIVNTLRHIDDDTTKAIKIGGQIVEGTIEVAEALAKGHLDNQLIQTLYGEKK